MYRHALVYWHILVYIYIGTCIQYYWLSYAA